MARRSIHYEAAFEDCLRARGCPFIVVDEARKAIFGDVALKSFDFIVYSASGPNLLVDVKGRIFPQVGRTSRKGYRGWENWITRDDVNGLRGWRDVFGADFLPALVFAYCFDGPPRRSPFSDVHIFRQKQYAFFIVELERYVLQANPRSEKWQTISVPSDDFVKIAKPLDEML